eukprot:SAG31_NODE_45910_length_256_cov_2.617834_1_plen_57_part_01
MQAGADRRALMHRAADTFAHMAKLYMQRENEAAARKVRLPRPAAWPCKTRFFFSVGF